MRLRLNPCSRLPFLLLLLGWVSCALKDPAGTSWTTALTVEAQPETLRVARILENPNTLLEGDSLLVFRQELDVSYARLGDSLGWEGVHQTLRLELGPLDLHGLGSVPLALPFTAAWPQYAAWVGQQTQISGQAEFSQLLTLPDWSELDWVAYSQAGFRLDLLHHWPFPLQWLEVELLNAQDQRLGLTHWEPAGGLPPEQALQSNLLVSGLLTRASRLRLRARHLPMAAPALIQDGALNLTLTQTMGLADSARARLPELQLVWSDSVWTASRLRILSALTAPARLRLAAVNELPVPLDLELELPQLRTGAGDGLGLALSVPALGTAQTLEEPGSLLVEDADGLDWLDVQGLGRTPASAGLVTVRARDALRLDLEVEPLELEEFEGWFLQEWRVPFAASETPVEEWPVELAALDLRGLELRLHLENQDGPDLEGHFELRATDSRLGLPDTLFVSDLDLQAADTLLLLGGADRLIARLPRHLGLEGYYRVPAGSVVHVRRESRVGLSALSLPARAQVNGLHWQSLPERHEDSLPEEAEQVRLQGEVENRLPAGGTVHGWVAAAVDGVRVPLFELEIAAAGWDGSQAEPVLSQLELELSAAALDVLRGGSWILWYEFEAQPGAGTVEIHADQWLALRARIQVLVDVTVEGGE
ncbi:MAG: hypothetical protein WC326_01225 [Candidatus Delongbacteria bacterium]